MTKKDFFESETDYDTYVEQTPLEARFDPLTIELLVTEAFPKHEAYGMLFKDYHVKRAQMAGHDDSEKKRLSFRFPKYYAHLATDIALDNKVSLHRALVLLIELGLIHFQVDYHNEYTDIREWRLGSYKGLVDSESLRKYRLIERHEIKISSAASSNAHFVPSVQEWLYNAIMDTKSYMNMSGTEFVFFCWCYGVLNCFDDGSIPEIVMEDLRSICGEFRYEIEEYQNQISRLK